LACHRTGEKSEKEAGKEYMIICAFQALICEYFLLFVRNEVLECWGLEAQRRKGLRLNDKNWI
jgi:hypothetical protein